MWYLVPWNLCRSYPLVLSPWQGEVPPASAGPGANEVVIEAALSTPDLGAVAGDIMVVTGNGAGSRASSPMQGAFCAASMGTGAWSW